MNLTLIPNDNLNFDIECTSASSKEAYKDSPLLPLVHMSGAQKGNWGRDLVIKCLEWHGLTALKRSDQGDITVDSTSSIIEAKLSLQGVGGKIWWNQISLAQTKWTDLALVECLPHNIRIFMLERNDCIQMINDESCLCGAGHYNRADVHTLMQIYYHLHHSYKIDELLKYSTLLLDCDPALIVK